MINFSILVCAAKAVWSTWGNRTLRFRLYRGRWAESCKAKRERLLFEIKYFWNEEKRMQYKVKVTVLDKSFIRNYNRNTAPYRTAANAPAIMWVMSFCFTATMRGTTFGTWVREHLWNPANRMRVVCNRRERCIAEQKVFRSVLRLGMLSAVIFIDRKSVV